MELLKSNKIEYTRELSIPIRGCVEPGEKACENKHYARLDFSIQDPRYPDTVTILSVDEHEHKTYGDASEISRILNVVTALQVRSENDKLWEHRPRKFRWIRYNPDSYRVNGNKRQKTLEEREKHLLRLLNTPPKKDRTLELIYAFYSLENGKTFIEESMPEMLRNCISERIV